MPLFGKKVGNCIAKYGSIPEWASGDLLKPIADELIKYAAPISNLDGERHSLNFSEYSKNERKIACKTGWVIMNKFQKALIEKAKLERDLQLAQEKLFLTEECLKSFQTKTIGDLNVCIDKGSELYRACPVTVTETQWKDCVGMNGMHEDAHTEVKEVVRSFTLTELTELVKRYKQNEGESLAEWTLRIFDDGADCVFLNASEVVCMGQLTLHPQVRNALRRVRSVRGNVPLLDFIRGALVKMFPLQTDLEPTSPCITMQDVIHRVRIMGCVVGLNANNWEGPDMEDFTACMRTRLLKCVSVQMKASIFSLLSGLGKTEKIHQLTSLLAEMVELNTPTNVCKTDLMEKEVRNECKNYKMHMSRRQVWNKLLRAGVCKKEIDGIPTAELIKRWNTIRAKTDRGSLNQPWSNLNKRPYSGYTRHAVPLHEKSSWWRAPPLCSRGPDSHECKEWGSDWKQKQSRAFVSVDGRMQMPLGNSIKPSDKRGLGAGCTDAAPVKVASDTKGVTKSVTVPPELFLGNGYLGRDSANSVGEKCSPVVHSPTMPVSQMQNRLPERLEKVETRPAESNQFKRNKLPLPGRTNCTSKPKGLPLYKHSCQRGKNTPCTSG